MRRPILCALSRAAVEYPDSDGKPLAENDAQLTAILYGIGALRVHFAGRRVVYVSGDLLIYYEEGSPRVSVAPDVFVVFGVEDWMRMSYIDRCGPLAGRSRATSRLPGKRPFPPQG